jgi:glucosyl-3-phosphoglycerate synthase
MSDFFQTGVVTTLHRLNRDRDSDDLIEAELVAISDHNRIGLVLPALYTEFQHRAMYGIVDELQTVRYLRRIVVAIGGATREQYQHAVSFFRRMPTPVTALWMEHPRIEELFRMLEEQGIGAGGPGKGRTCWLCYGYLLAREDVDIIALHDCDIRNYDKSLLTRLCYPVANPNLGFEFCKGFYARVSNKLHGRVMRLFFTPLVRALLTLQPTTPFLRYLDSFRYALSGEFAMRADLARVNLIPSDWGLEVGVLAEMFRNCSISRICQVDIADNYEHKHQALSERDASGGLRRMTLEIAKSLFRTLAAQGCVLGDAELRTLLVHYQQLAQDTINKYYADAMLNGLQFDRHAEASAVTAFSESLREAAAAYTDNPLSLPIIPSWNRVLHAIPGFFDLILDAAEEMEMAAD